MIVIEQWRGSELVVRVALSKRSENRYSSVIERVHGELMRVYSLMMSQSLEGDRRNVGKTHKIVAVLTRFEREFDQ